MTIFVSDVISEEFIKTLPFFIVQIIDENIKNNKKRKYNKMNKYLQDNFKLSIDTVVDTLLKKGFNFNKVKHTYTITINYAIREPMTGLKIDSLVRLIDFGNTEIKGIHLIDTAIDYISNNILNIYRLYQNRLEIED